MKPIYLSVGGLIAMGFDATGKYLLTVSHSGRGVFSTETWERVGRDVSLPYPDNNICVGIPPIKGEKVSIEELDYDTGKLSVTSPDLKFTLNYSEGIIEVCPVIT